MTLRTARMRAGLSQAELARRIGRSPAFVNLLEAGRTRKPTYDDVTNIARELNCNPSDLSFGRPRRQAVA